MLTDKDLTILFVDDEPGVLNSLRRFLRKEPYSSLFASGGEEALNMVESHDIQIVVTDLRMPGMSGLDLIKRIKEEHPEILRMVLSASRDIEDTLASINTGEVFRFVTKPLDPDYFRDILRDGVDYYLLKASKNSLMKELAASNLRLEKALGTITEVTSHKEKLELEAKGIESKIEQQLLRSESPQNLLGVSVGAFSIPSGHLDGDFFDFYTFGNQSFDLVIGDVMGKGLQSALVGAGLKYIILKSLAQYSCSLGNTRINCPDKQPGAVHSLIPVFDEIHKHSYEKLSQLEMFVTLFYARFDIANRTMSYINCGHTRSILFRPATVKTKVLGGNNLPLGIEQEAKYVPIEIDLQGGDILVFYSDGVTEAENSDGDFFGEQRLADVLTANPSQTAAQCIDELPREVMKFTGKSSFSDDFTCIAVQLDPSLPGITDHE